jgi:hypothetical protein
MALINIPEIILGAKYLNNCPIQQYIPIFVLAAGCTGLVFGLLSALSAFLWASAGTTEAPLVVRCMRAFASLAGLVTFAWLIAGKHAITLL